MSGSIGFTHLHVHDEFSLLDGMSKVDALASLAKELGFACLAQTNHGNVDGAVVFTKECKKRGIKPIVGSELYVVDDPTVKDSVRYHLVVLAKNENGFRYLCRGLSRANLEGFYRKPRLAWSWVLGMEDVIVLTACTSGMLSHPQYVSLVRKFYDKFGVDFYAEVMPLSFDKQYVINNRALEVQKHLPVRLVATNDVHYLRQGDETTHEVLLSMAQKTKWADPNRWKFSVSGLYVRTADEMIQAFDATKFPRKLALAALECTNEIVEKCKTPVAELPVRLPLPHMFHGKDPDAAFRRLVEKGFQWRGLGGREEYRSRINREVKDIVELGFSAYFLIIWELIWWCRRNDIMCGPGRGSVGGSLVAYCLGITEVDPIQYRLPFERFISAGRIDLPDVDMDFEDRYRDRIFAHLQDLYGIEKVAKIKTYSKLHGRAALRDVSRVFDVPLGEASEAAELIVQRSGGDAREDFSIEDACEVFEVCKAFKVKYPEVVQHAVKLEGLIRHPSIHAAGVVVADRPLIDGELCALAFDRDGTPLVNWSKLDLEYRGLMKLDILGLKTLTILHEIQSAVLDHYGVCIDWPKISLQDDAIFKEFSAGNTVGVFQFGSYGLQRFCTELGIDSFKSVVDASALHRPGTLKSGLITDYCERKNGLQPVPKIHPLYDRLTEDTFGIVLYQEQIMYLLNQLAGVPWQTVDTIRKVVSKKQGLDKMRAAEGEFVSGCLKMQTLSVEDAKRIWEQIVFFGAYSFNHAHAVEYGLLGYWTMYAKVYYPKEFMVACLNYGQAEKQDLYVRESRRLGLGIDLPNINMSHTMWSIGGGDNLIAGLITIKGISDKTALSLVRSRDKQGGEFKDWQTFLKSIDRRRCNIRSLEALMRAGAFRCFGIGPCTPSAVFRQAVTDNSVPDSVEVSSWVEMDAIADVLEFSPDTDPLRKYRSLILTTGRWWGAKRIKDIDYYNHPDYDIPYIGVLQEVKFGYRERLGKSGDESAGSLGYADALGGVYSNFFDGDDFCMIVIDTRALAGNAYMKNKVEGAKDAQVIVWARPVDIKLRGQKPRRIIHASWVVMLDDLLAGVFNLPDGLKTDMRLYAPNSGIRTYRRVVEECRQCQLGALRTRSVPMEFGQYRVVVIAEAPGHHEDISGIPLVGDAGTILWNTFLEYGIQRAQVCVTNVLKCRPINNKYDPKDADVCAPLWLQKELKVVDPMVVMLLGSNAAAWAHPGDMRKVDERQDVIEWSNRLGCWVVYGPHPASLLYAKKEGHMQFSKRQHQLRCACANVANLMNVLHRT